MPGPSGRDEAGLPSVEPGDTLRLQVWSSVACTFRAVVRIRPVGGKTAAYPFEVTAGATRATASQIYKLERGGIIDSVMVEATPKGTETAPTQRGQSYAKLDLTNGGCLACGYVYPGHQPALNEFVEPGPAGGPGAMTRVNTAATVTAGRVLMVAPTGAIWRPHAGVGFYTGSATVGNRSVRFRWRDGSGNVYRRHIPQTVAASQALGFVFELGISEIIPAPGSALDTATNGPANSIGAALLMPATYDLFVLDTAAIDGLDTVSIESQVEEWVVPS